MAGDGLKLSGKSGIKQNRPVSHHSWPDKRHGLLRVGQKCHLNSRGHIYFKISYIYIYIYMERERESWAGASKEVAAAQGWRGESATNMSICVRLAAGVSIAAIFHASLQRAIESRHGFCRI